MQENRSNFSSQFLQAYKPKKIAMLGSMPPLRALSSYCLELAPAIADHCDVEFISFKKIYPSLLYPGGHLEDDNSFPLVKHPRLNIRRRLTWYNPATWISEGMLSGTELLHAQWWSPPLALIYTVICLGFRLRKRPVIFTVHNVRPHENSIFYQIACSLLFKLADHFIVHSDLNKKQLITLYRIPPEKVACIPHGPLNFHIEVGLDRDKIRADLGLVPEDRVVLLFGAIRPYKGISTALKAFSKVISRIPNARLLVAGKPWEDWKPHHRLIQNLGIGDYVKSFLKYIPSGEVYKFFEAADLVVLPYEHFDSQSGVGAAAISFKRPMIVTDAGGLSDLVLDKRCVVPPEEPEALAETIIQCLQDPERLERMSADAGALAERMSWSFIAKRTVELYSRVLAEPDIHRK